MIDEFAEDGVVYLELRSTPRAIPDTSVTQKSYMRTILKAISDKTSTVDDLKAYLVSVFQIEQKNMHQFVIRVVLFGTVGSNELLQYRCGPYCQKQIKLSPLRINNKRKARITCIDAILDI